MLRSFTPIARGALVAGALAVGLSIGLVHAQAPAPTSSYPLVLTPDRVMALVRAADRGLPYVPGEVLVKFKDGVSRAGQQQALRAVRSQPSVGELQWKGRVALLRDPRESDGAILAAQLREQPEVEYAEPNYLYHLDATPNDPGFTRAQWNLTAIDMPRAWDINPGGRSDLTVAVIDSGVTSVNQTFTFSTWNGSQIANIGVPFGVNPDFGIERLVDARDFVFWDGPVLDMVGHGTHVSSTIGEDTNNNLAEAGIAYKTKVMPLKVCVGFWEIQFALSDAGQPGSPPLDAGGCPADAIVDAILYAADRGAKVINLSLGGPMPSAAVRDAMMYAVEKGAFIAASIGNEYEDGNPVEYPAADAATVSGAMSVGALGPSLSRAYYSNTGSHLEVTAPGGDFRAGGFDGMIWQATIFDADSDPATVHSPRFDRYVEYPYQGTSMATPHVSGIAALIITQGVTNPAAVEALIQKTARDLGTAGRDNEYGYGLIQPRAALFGYGVAR